MYRELTNPLYLYYKHYVFAWLVIYLTNNNDCVSFILLIHLEYVHCAKPTSFLRYRPNIMRISLLIAILYPVKISEMLIKVG